MTTLEFTPQEIIEIFTDDFYGIEGFNQNGYLYSYSKTNFKMIRKALNALSITYEDEVKELREGLVYVQIVNYDELLEKMNRDNKKLRNTVEYLL